MPSTYRVHNETVTVSFNNRSFPFRLTCEKLDLSLPNEVSYWSMHGGDLRRAAGGRNLRSVIDLWWELARRSGISDEHYILRLWAEVYSLVNTARSQQSVFADAYLGKNIDLSYSLPESEVEDLKALVLFHGLRWVQHTLESLLMGDLPSDADRSRFTEIAQDWLNTGLMMFKTFGETGLRSWLILINAQIKEHRKRGRADFMRRFINLFAYEAKVSFHRSYSDVWRFLVQWLKEHRSLDDMSERLMRFMHYCNCDVYTDGLTPEQRRGPLCGQVLSLHPVGRFLLAQSHNRIALGELISVPDYFAHWETKAMQNTDAYRNVMASILIAATEYHHTREHSNARRRKSAQVEAPIHLHCQEHRNDEELNCEKALTEFARDQKWKCEQCDAELKFDRIVESSNSEVSVIRYCCMRGESHDPIEKQVSQDQLKAWL